jgi:hypothetical protein
MNLEIVLKQTRALAQERLASQMNTLDEKELEFYFRRFSKGLRHISEGQISLRDWWTTFGPNDRFDVLHPDNQPRKLIYAKAQLKPPSMAPAMLQTHGYVAGTDRIAVVDALNAFWNAALDILLGRVDQQKDKRAA